MKHLILAFFVASIVILGFIKPVLANDTKFSTTYKTTYDVAENGVTTVTSNLELKNLTPNFYASSFQVTPGFKKIYDVVAYDRLGNCQVTVANEMITVNFNDKAVGQNTILKWSLIYKTAEVASKKGRVWEVSLPRVSNVDNSIVDYLTALKVPKSFGEATGLDDIAATTGNEGTKKVYVFNKDTIINQGISASFGDWQLLKYELKYHLKNPLILPIVQEITLPPTISYRQEIFINSLNPTPLSFRKDIDGNLYARYFLKPMEDLEISLGGGAKIYNRRISPSVGGQLANVPTNLDYLTKPQPFWESDNSQIKNVTITETNSEDNVSQTARKLYDYVTKTLTYNVNKGFDSRLGALGVLQDPKNAVCGEFADLFVTLCRSSGIPARGLEGWAATDEVRIGQSDVLHAWSEYFDPVFGWVAVDPTWGNTAKTDFFTHLDTNRLVLAIHGASSTSPPPAGAFKFDTNEENQVIVAFSDQVDEKNVIEIVAPVYEETIWTRLRDVWQGVL